MRDHPALTQALTDAAARFGSIDVLEYSPAPHSPVPGITLAAPSEATVENLQPQIDYYLYGALHAAQVVRAVHRQPPFDRVAVRGG